MSFSIRSNRCLRILLLPRDSAAHFWRLKQLLDYFFLCLFRMIYTLEESPLTNFPRKGKNLQFPFPYLIFKENQSKGTEESLFHIFSIFVSYLTIAKAGNCHGHASLKLYRLRKFFCSKQYCLTILLTGSLLLKLFLRH